MDLALINLPPWSQENPHIGLAYLGSYLRQRGFSFKLFDLNKLFFNAHPDRGFLWHVENKNYWSNKRTFTSVLEIFKEDIEKAVAEIAACDAGILGFSVVDPKERLTIEFIKRIKRKAPAKRVILGGPATSTREQRKIFLDHAEKDVDFFVIGEGEITLGCLMERVLNKQSTEGLTGCYFRKNGQWDYVERPPVHPLDSLPFPTYEEFDMGLYSRSLLVEWSRGCHARCAFCKNYKLFPVFRSKSPEWVVRELRYHRERYRIEEFTVVDNVLNGDPSNLRAICARINREGVRLRWSGQMAPRKEMDLDFFKEMKEAGCFKLQIGLESASDKVLKLMRKPFTADISERNIRDAKKAGIETEIFVMAGFPGETEEDFDQTCDFVTRNSASIDAIKSINTLHLIAGTDIYEQAKHFGLKQLPKENWHYLWETRAGNSYPVRKARAEKLLELAGRQNIKVIETNICEGKEQRSDLLNVPSEPASRIELTKPPPVRSRHEEALPQSVGAVERSFRKRMLLYLVTSFVLVYMAYFGFFALVRGRVLLGGKKRDNK